MPAKGLGRLLPLGTNCPEQQSRWNVMLKEESYIYEIGKMRFIVEPVYKDKGETIKDILLKLMLAELGLE